MALSHEGLVNFYNTNFQMMQHHKYSLSELEDMMPWEREIYLILLRQHIAKENSEHEKRNR